MQAFEIVVPAAHEDVATAVLSECGTAGIEVRPAPRGRVLLLAYFPRRRGLAARLRAALAAQRAEVRPVAVPRVNWVARFREGFRPFTAGRFQVVPRWMAGTRSRDADTIVVEPGRAFGTGTHASTRLCLHALEELAAVRPLGAVADLGTGTGILAIAALRLGAASALGVDVDPIAIEATRANARRNRVARLLKTQEGSLPSGKPPFDLVLANLIASLLVRLAPELAAELRPGGSLIASGIFRDREPDVVTALTAVGLAVVERAEEGDWVALTLRR